MNRLATGHYAHGAYCVAAAIHFLSNKIATEFERIKHLKTAKWPFANLPELAAGRWGQGLTAEKMEECVWLRPELVAQIQFSE